MPFIPPFGTPPTDISNLSKNLYDAVVDAAGNGDFTDIESAIDDGAKSIFVLDGTYTLTNSINVDVAGILIIGETRTGVIVDDDNGSYDAFTVTANNFDIRNLTIKNLTSKAGILISSASLTVNIDNILFDTADIGIKEGADSLTVRINNCSFPSGYPTTSGGISRLGIIGGASCKTWISNCEVVVDNALDFGIRVGNLSTNGGETIIDNCIITVDGGKGMITESINVPTKISGCSFLCKSNTIGIEMSARGRVANCYFKQGTGTATVGEAIFVVQNLCEINGNIIEGGFWDGILLNSNNNTIVGNTIRSCKNDGIFLNSIISDENIMMGNIITSNGQYGINIGDSGATGNIIAANTFKSNTSGNINITSGATVEIAHNVEN